MSRNYKPKRRDMLPLWTDAYLSDTNMLTCQQHGAYLLLLMTCWRTSDCRLPNDDRKLARCAELTVKVWNKIKEDVLQFWQVSKCGNWITQKKLYEIYLENCQYRKQQSSNSKNDKIPKGNTSNQFDNPQTGTAPLSQAIENIEDGGNLAVAATVAVKDTTLISAREQVVWKANLEKCIEAARPCLRETAIAFLAYTEIRNWVEDPNFPCDLELDVLPAISETANRTNKKNISTWKYFQSPVMEARDRRLAGNPKPQTPPKPHGGQYAKTNYKPGGNRPKTMLGAAVDQYKRSSGIGEYASGSGRSEGDLHEGHAAITAPSHRRITG